MKIFNRKDSKSTRAFLRNNVFPPEKILWKHLSNKQLGFKCRRQHGIENYIVDFNCPELFLIIEIDGKVHDEAEG